MKKKVFVGNNLDTEYLWRVCSSPNCFRVPEFGHSYCCNKCMREDSQTADRHGHWNDCNFRHTRLFRLKRKLPLRQSPTQQMNRS